MKHLESIIGEKNDILTVPCYIKVKSSCSKIIGIHDRRLKIAVAAPPVDGKANAELQRFLAKKLAISKSSISIISGESSRRKLLEIKQLSAQELIRRIC